MTLPSVIEDSPVLSTASSVHIYHCKANFYINFSLLGRFLFWTLFSLKAVSALARIYLRATALSSLASSST